MTAGSVVSPDQLRPLVAYNRWANDRLLHASAALDAGERERDLRASFTSLHGTLAHILWGERGWLHFWQKGGFPSESASGDYRDFARLHSAWRHHHDAYATYLLGLTQHDLNSRRTVDDDEYALSDLVEHVLNHSTHHRGQVTLMIRQLGHAPPETGYRHFLTEWRSSGIH